MDERLDYDIQMAEGTEDILCPRFLLQPLVENAIVHGIDPLENGGYLTINAHMTGAIIEICIHDNGLGMSSEALHDLEDRLSSGVSAHRDSAKFNGLGMNNVIQRMKYLYGSSFESRLISDEGHGFTVILLWKGAARNEASNRR